MAQHRLRLIACLCSLSLFAHTAAWAEDAQAAEELTKGPSKTAESDKPLKPKYPVTVQVDNQELQELLEKYLPIIDHQRREELDDEQINFLAEDTPKEAQNLLKTEGYFNAQVSVSRQGAGWLVKVAAGERTHIDQVNVAILGDILKDRELGTYYKNALRSWQLPVGAPFRQEHWSASKTAALSAVTRRKYPLATLTQTQATVNPQTHRADLSVQINSQQPIYFGDFQIEGNRRYPVSVVEGLAQFKPGDVYDLDKLLDYQQALENNSHYSGASVQAAFDERQGDRVPVKVSVIELPRQKIEAGLSFDSEYGLGGSLGYEHYNLFNRGYVGSTSFAMDRYQTNFSVGISQPRQSSGYYWTSNLAYKRNTTQKLETRSVTSGIWRVRDRNDIEARYGIEFIAEDGRIPEQNLKLDRRYATMLTASWRKQSIETTLRPANGYYFDGKIGTTLGRLMSSSFMARVKGSAGYYFTPENKALGTFVVRGELGYVYSNGNYNTNGVPSTLMFRTGGASSVRGYELDSIGRRIPGSSAVLPERAMFVTSLEYQYPIKNDFALAVFHDIGGTAQTFQAITPRHGTGLGVRWFSPIAPFSFDIAYGHHDRKIRWHISLGTRF